MYTKPNGGEGREMNCSGNSEPCHAILTAPAMLAIFNTTPLDLTSIGAKACVTASKPHTFTSNSFLLSSTLVSRRGMTNMRPALFTKTSRRPAVFFSTVAAQEEMDDALVTSRGRISISGCDASEAALAELRRVAKT